MNMEIQNLINVYNDLIQSSVYYVKGKRYFGRKAICDNTCETLQDIQIT